MARTDEQELAIRLEARIRDFERNMERARRAARRDFDRINRDAERSSQELEGSFARAGRNIGNNLKAGLLAGLSVAALGGIAKSLTDVTRGVANIGNEAKRAGVSAKAFQELSYVAKQNRIEVDALIDGLKELNLRTDELIQTGAGPAAEAFQRLGYSAAELKRKLKDPSDLMVEIIGRMEKLDRASQIRIADELFGGEGGERFVELLDRGAEGIRTLIQEANDLGLVLDDQMIAKADEIDRKFGKITETVSVNLKRAVVEVVDAMDGFFDQFRKLEAQADRTIQLSLHGIYSDRIALIDRIADLETQKSDSFFPGAIDTEIKIAQAELKKLTDEAMRLRDVLDRRQGYSETFVYTGEEAGKAEPKVSTLADTVEGLNGAGSTGAKGLETFTDAVRALKGEIPGLAGQLADMDAKMRIQDAYRAALKNARSIGDTMIAEQLRDSALDALTVKTATADSSGYLGGRLAAGRGASHVTGMSGDFADALATMLASAPENVRAATTINSGFRSFQRQAELFDAAVKKYGSEKAARKWVAPPGKSRHNSGQAADLGFQTDEARQWFHANAGKHGLAFPMKHEPWHIEGAEARRQADDAAFQENYTAGQAEQERKAQAAKDQAATYQEIIAGANQFRQAQTLEAQALSMTATQAQALRYEQDLLNQAQAAGIALSPTQTAELQKLAQGMAQVEAATMQAAQSQEQIQAAQGFLQQQVGGFFSSIITGSSSAEEALGRLLASLAEAALQAALFGGGPMGSMFGGMGGGILGTLFTAFTGVPALASGGHVRGPGSGTSDSITARLSDGEFVVNAKATAKHRAVLEAINSGKLPGYATGGLVGRAPITAPTFTGASTGAPAINLSTSVTVNANGGDEKQNQDLAAKTGKETEQAVRALVIRELSTQMRPGGLLRR